MAAPWVAKMAPSMASGLPRPAVAPNRMAASIAAVETRPACVWSIMPRTKCRWVTCAVSCAMTPASSSSLRVASIKPELMAMKPPGIAKALMTGSRTTK